MERYKHSTTLSCRSFSQQPEYLSACVHDPNERRSSVSAILHNPTNPTNPQILRILQILQILYGAPPMRNTCKLTVLVAAASVHPVETTFRTRGTRERHLRDEPQGEPKNDGIVAGHICPEVEARVRSIANIANTSSWRHYFAHACQKTNV